MSDGLTHLGPDGAARMVDVGSKKVTTRVAVAGGRVRMAEDTLAKVLGGSLAKGEVLQVARIAGIQAAKRTGDLIPLCHPLGLDSIRIDFQRLDDRTLGIFAAARLSARTGIEMEALTAVSVAALTVYDMAKAVDKAMVIGDVKLLFKSGGKSTHCALEGRVGGSGGVPGPGGEADVLAFPPSEAPAGAWITLLGVPAALLPEDLWLVFEGGARALLVQGSGLRFEGSAGAGTLPPEGASVVVRPGQSYT